MNIYGSSFAAKAFGECADKNLIVTFESHREAHRYVASALEEASGIAILQGPRGAGKTTFINELVPQLQRKAPVAVFDGAKTYSQPDVSAVLSEFVVDVATETDDRLLQKLSAYVREQTETGAAPVLIVDNADQLEPGALSLLNWLADLDARGRWAMRFVLTGRAHLNDLIDNYSMRYFVRRHPIVFDMQPLSKQETVVYLRTKFVAAGGEDVERVVSLDVCDELHEKSNGWPGRLNELAMEAIGRDGENARAQAAPRIIVSRDDEVVAEHALTKRATIIGRDRGADIVIDDSYVSKRHAMLQLDEAGVELLDLNSTNGTRVNSVETLYSILQDNDIITIGRYELKIERLPVVSEEMVATIRGADTLTFENPDDIRQSRAKRLIRRSNTEKDHAARPHLQASDQPVLLRRSAT